MHVCPTQISEISEKKCAFFSFFLSLLCRHISFVCTTEVNRYVQKLWRNPALSNALANSEQLL